TKLGRARAPRSNRAGVRRARDGFVSQMATFCLQTLSAGSARSSSLGLDRGLLSRHALRSHEGRATASFALRQRAPRQMGDVELKASPFRPQRQPAERVRPNTRLLAAVIVCAPLAACDSLP